MAPIQRDRGPSLRLVPRCSTVDDALDVAPYAARDARCVPLDDARELELAASAVADVLSHSIAASVADVLAHFIDKRMRELFPEDDTRLRLAPPAASTVMP